MVVLATPPAAIDTKAPATAQGTGAPRPAVFNPFTRAAKEHVEQIFDVSATHTTSARKLGSGVLEVPAFGYMRHVMLIVEATGGTGAAAVAKADAPWSALSEVVLTDVNGQTIYGPVSGYDLYLTNLFGGYSFDPDPTRSPIYSAVQTSGNYAFALRIPVEITHQDGLGALANQNASSTFKLSLTLAPLTDVYATNPTGTPTTRVRAFLEAWTQPFGTDATGVPNETQPPALGTTQNWTKESKVIAAGSQSPRLARVGNAIRNLVLVCRDATGARSATILPDPLTVLWDGRQLVTLPRDLLRHYMQERYGLLAAQMPTGVYALDFTHDADGHPGGELRNGWLFTTQASRIELQGSYGAAGTLDVLTNDVLAFADANI